jgi:fluoride exporter
MSSLILWLGVGATGGLGALFRFRLDRLVQLRGSAVFPYGTLAVNLLGTFSLGVLTGLGVTGDALLLVGAGLLGSLTTFSTVALETERLAEEGEGRLALANVAASLAAGIAVGAVGWLLGAGL